jgi:hypothetical protein
MDTLSWCTPLPAGLPGNGRLMAVLPLVETAAMTPAELRSRIARSGISGKHLAELLGIPQPNVSGWCTGIRPIPAHHIAAIIRLTDNPPARTEPAWRPPADMPAGRSKGWGSKVSRQRRAARVERAPSGTQPTSRSPCSIAPGSDGPRAGPLRQPALSRPAKATTAKPAIDRAPPELRRESDAPVGRLDRACEGTRRKDRAGVAIPWEDRRHV